MRYETQHLVTSETVVAGNTYTYTLTFSFIINNIEMLFIDYLSHSETLNEISFSDNILTIKTIPFTTGSNFIIIATASGY